MKQTVGPSNSWRSVLVSRIKCQGRSARLPTMVVGFILLLRSSMAFQSAEVHSPGDLVTQLLSALNTKDSQKIRRVIERYVIPNAPVDQRVSRWKALAEQGAPFTFVRELSLSKDEIDTVIVDKDKNRIALIVHFESNPHFMIAGMRLAPAYTLEGPPPSLMGWTDLKSLAKTIRASSKAPGIAISTIRNGVQQTVVAGFRKVHGNENVDSDDVWSIGSIGKPLCATVIARLIEQGKLNWNETLRSALPGEKMNPGYEAVTLEQIMHHRGGIPEDLGFTKPEVDRMIGNAKTATTVRDRYTSNILSRKPISLPGKQFNYSNGGYAVLSHVIERTTGKPYESVLKELIFKPLGLKHSFTGADQLPKMRPSGHFDGPKGLEPGDMSGPMEMMFAGAGGGIYMSAGDLALFGLAHLDGLQGKDGLLKASTIQRLHQGIAEQPGGSRQYACGWGIESLPGIQTFHGHNGSNGTMRAQLAIFPDSSIVVAAVVNRGGEDEPAPGLQAVLAIGAKYARK